MGAFRHRHTLGVTRRFLAGWLGMDGKGIEASRGTALFASPDAHRFCYPKEPSMAHAHASLEPLEGYAFPVLTSANAGPQWQRVASRCEKAHSYLSGILEFTPRFRLLVISPQDWGVHARFPL